jgi:hypothetical protein
MKFAETVRTRWFLALASVAAAGTLIAVMPCKHDRAPLVKAMTTVKPWTECHQRKVVQQAARHESTEPSGSDYRDVLLTAKPAFEACTAKQPSGVVYEIRMPIGSDGHVTSVEVRGQNADLSKVSMKVVKCLETAVAHLQFPATGTQTFVSTNIKTQ